MPASMGGLYLPGVLVRAYPRGGDGLRFESFVNTSPLSEGLYDAILPLRILLWMAIPAGIKHIACR